MQGLSGKQKNKDELLRAVDSCTSIAELFELVRCESIDIRMRTMNGASCLEPQKPHIPANPDESPLQKLKLAVKSAVLSTR